MWHRSKNFLKRLPAQQRWRWWLLLLIPLLALALLWLHLHTIQSLALVPWSRLVSDFGMLTLLVLTVMLLARQLWHGRTLEDHLENRALEVQRLALVANTTNNAIAILTRSGRVEWVNQAFTSLTGQLLSDAMHRRLDELLCGSSTDKAALIELQRHVQQGLVWQGEMLIYSKNGQELWLNLALHPMLDRQDKLLGIIFIGQDLRPLKASEARIESLAHFDKLTGLAQREWFLRRASALMEGNKSGAVLFIQFTRFPMLRSSLGQDLTDRAVLAIVERINEILQSRQITALFSRMGTSRFALFVGPPDLEKANELADQLLQSMLRPFYIEAQAVQVPARVGLASTIFAPDSAEDLLRNAEIAAQTALESKLGGVVCFDRTMREKLEQRQLLETDLRRAIYFESEQLFNVYQPIYQLDNNRLAGFEVLARWQHPQRGLVSPLDFINVAEESGLIVPLWTVIMLRALRQQVQWNSARADKIFVSLNLSSRQFFLPGLLRVIDGIMAMTGADPTLIKLEITESHIMEETAYATKQMVELRQRGFRVSIDDFGAGYSSLSYLHKLPVDDLKIDRSFLVAMRENDSNLAIIRTIAKLGQLLNLELTAEGIETESDLAIIRNMQVQFGQGFYFAKPLSAADAEKLLPPPTQMSQAQINQTQINPEPR